MGEHEPNRPARLLAALSTAAVAGLLLTSCAGLARAGTAADPSESAPSTSASASAPAPDETSTAPVEEPSPAQTEAAAKAPVEPFITLPPTWNGEGLDVGALVPKIVETGGTCTATAERDGVAVSRSGAAAAASSYTGCPQLLITGAELVPGTWTVTVAYASADSEGTSKPVTVTIR